MVLRVGLHQGFDLGEHLIPGGAQLLGHRRELLQDRPGSVRAGNHDALFTQRVEHLCHPALSSPWRVPRQQRRKPGPLCTDCPE